MAKLVFKNSRFYLACDHAQREIAKKAGFKWCAEHKLWMTEDKFKALLATEIFPDIDNHESACEVLGPLASKKYWSNHGEFPDAHCSTEGLKTFQQTSVWRMTACDKQNQNWLLADEPRLGKTIQVVGVINEKLNTPIDGSIRVLIICPATVKLNWKKELQKWVRKDVDAHYHIINKNAEYFGSVPQTARTLLDVKIINYDLLSPGNMAHLRSFGADIMVLDEEHALKNRQAQRTQKVLLAKDALIKFAKQTIALTGTPITKHPSDIWALCRAACPQAIAPYLNYWDFVNQFCQVVNKPFGKEIVGSKNEEELSIRLRSTFMIRRTKAQVLPQLPRVQYQIITLAKDKATGEIVKKEQALPKDELELAMRRHTVKANGHLATLRKELGLAKLSQCVEFIKDQLESEEKIVIFAWHTDVIETLAKAMREADFGTVVITGSTPNDQRQKIVDCFQTNKDCRVFIGNILAAGEGITLNAASRIIFVESSWLPKDIEQASMRCESMLEKNSVLAQFLVVEDSIDANVLSTVVERMNSINKII